MAESAEAAARVQLAELPLKYGVWKQVAFGVILVCAILASAVPLEVVRSIVQSVSGKTTTVNLSTGLSTALGVSVVLNLGQIRLAYNRKRTVTRLEARARKVETEFGLKAEGSQT